MHIRGTDSPWAKLYSSVSAFENHIDETILNHPDASFFLATDEPAIKDRLFKEYGSRMLFLDQASYDRNSSGNIQNALVDVLCLAATREVFGTYFSTFSRLAADWNGIEETTVFKPSTDLSS